MRDLAFVSAIGLGIVSAFIGIGGAWVPFVIIGLFVAGSAWLGRKQPRDTLMQLAEGISGPPPPEIASRAARIAERVKRARVPLSQEEELRLLDTTPAPRFKSDDPAWMLHLDQEGYAVIASIAQKEELARAEDLLWEFLEKHAGWERSSNETWTDEGMEKIGCVHRGLVNGAGMGHSDFMWYLRTLPKVREVFEYIWGTDNLIVSFDGANLFRPWHHGFKKTMGGWWHVDQGKAKQGRHAVQGFVSLFQADGRSGGLTVVPRSHLRFSEVVEDQQNPHKDYCTVQNYSAVLQELPRRLVCCQPGDLVLWDSRTVHANAPASEQPIAPADKLLRAVGYICMTPARFASGDVRKHRRTAYEYRVSTSHWPHQFDVGFAGDEPPRSLRDASPEVIALVG